MNELLQNIKMIRDQLHIIHSSSLSKEVKQKRVGQLMFMLDFVECRYDFEVFQEMKKSS